MFLGDKDLEEHVSILKLEDMTLTNFLDKTGLKLRTIYPWNKNLRIIDIPGLSKKRSSLISSAETKEKALIKLCENLSNKILIKDIFPEIVEIHTKTIYLTEKEMKMKKVRDQFGILIEKDSYITYPVRGGNDLVMRVAKVLSIEKHSSWNGDMTVLKVLATQFGSNSFVKTTVYCLDRVIVLSDAATKNVIPLFANVSD